MEKLVLVHLSDIHFTGSSGTSVHDLDSEVRNEILRDAATVTKKLGGATGVLVTGDIAFSVNSSSPGNGARRSWHSRTRCSSGLKVCRLRRLEYEEWDWLREQAPSVSWYRDWDQCERLAAALARLLEKRDASLETVFTIVYSRPAIRKMAAILDDDRDTRPYLKSLRESVESSSIGTREQREALLEDW